MEMRIGHFIYDIKTKCPLPGLRTTSIYATGSSVPVIHRRGPKLGSVRYGLRCENYDILFGTTDGGNLLQSLIPPRVSTHSPMDGRTSQWVRVDGWSGLDLERLGECRIPEWSWSSWVFTE